MKIKNENVVIKHLNKNDLVVARQLFMLFKQVFEVADIETVKKGHLKNLLKKEYFICLAAIHNDEVIGGLTAYELPMYNSKSPEIFIYDIAVKPGFQRMGIGKMLLIAITAYATECKIKVIFVDACESDIHALDFYRSAKGKEENVVQFTFNVLTD